MTKLTPFAALAAAIATIGILGAANVATAQQRDVMIVRISDLNVASPQGAQTALRRIKSAANKFCGPESREVGRSYAQKGCVKRMTSQAVARLDAPLVTALHSSHQPIQLASAETTTR